jgi:hypothetical protein
VPLGPSGVAQSRLGNSRLPVDASASTDTLALRLRDEREHSGAHRPPFPTKRQHERRTICDGSSLLEGVFAVAIRLGSA